MDVDFSVGFVFGGVTVAIIIAIFNIDGEPNDCKQKYDTYKCISVLLPHDHPEVLKNEDH